MPDDHFAITGLGMVTCLGESVDCSWTKLVAGTSGLHRRPELVGVDLPCSVLGLIDPSLTRDKIGVPRAVQLLATVVDQAIEQAGLTPGEISRSSLVIALCPFDLTWDQRLSLLDGIEQPESVFEDVAELPTDDSWLRQLIISGVPDALVEHYDLIIPPITIHTACSSGNSAIQIARESLIDGESDIAIVAGCEISSSADTIVRFGMLKTLANSADSGRSIPRPFAADRDGFVIGEGAAALVMQRRSSAEFPALALVAGCGEAVDIHHRTRSDPEAKAAIKAIRMALRDAGATPDDVDYINAHGTGTFENDRTEARAILEVFGDRGRRLPVSSNKSMVGHTLSAAGVVEAVFCVKTLQTGICPPTINYHEPDPEIPLNVVPNSPQYGDVRVVLSNSFGFGGQNVCVLFRRAE